MMIRIVFHFYTAHISCARVQTDFILYSFKIKDNGGCIHFIRIRSVTVSHMFLNFARKDQQHVLNQF
jgi:hypothetical protein